MRAASILVLALLVPGASVRPGHAATAADTVLADLHAEARALEPGVGSPLARAFLDAAHRLPAPEARVVWSDSARTRWWSDAAALRLAPEARGRLVRRTLDERFYYHTRYGTPLAYARAYDLLGGAGLADLAGKVLVDFGHGSIGPLRLAALMGAEAVGVEVDPLLPALYAGPADQGRLPGGRGSVRLVNGRFPADPEAARAAGRGWDVFLSKNTLKRGYVHPEQPVDPRQTVQLGVDDSTFVSEVFARLKPGGLMLIYNLSPAPAKPGERYIPWADGRCPFDRALLERAGFEVLSHDAVDDAAARALGHALGWDRGPRPMDLEHDLFARYTLARRPGR